MSVVITCEDGEIKKQFNGYGSKEDPIVINSIENIPLFFEIYESNQHILMKNIELDYLGLYYTENFSIENCKFEALELYHCSNLTIKNSEINRSILSQSKNCHIEKNKYKQEFCIFKSHKNLIQNCVFERLFHNPDHLSRENVIKDNEINENDTEELKEIDVPLKDEKNTFLIDERYGWSLVECEGTGTKEDPIIIGPQDRYSQVIYINRNRKHIIFNNFNPNHLKFYNSKNITIKNSNFQSVDFEICSNIKIKNIVSSSLYLGKNLEIVLENSKIYKIKPKKDFDKKQSDITFINSSIKYVKEKYFNDFNLKSTDIENVISTKSIKEFFKEHKAPFLFTFAILMGILLAILIVVAAMLNLVFLGYAVIIIFFISIPISIGAGYLSDLKRKKEREKWQEEHGMKKALTKEKSEEMKKSKIILLDIVVIGFIVSMFLGAFSSSIFPDPIDSIVFSVCMSYLLICLYLFIRLFPPLPTFIIGGLLVAVGLVLVWINLLVYDPIKTIFYLIPSITMIIIGVMIIIDSVRFNYKNKI